MCVSVCVCVRMCACVWLALSVRLTAARSTTRQGAVVSFSLQTASLSAPPCLCALSLAAWRESRLQPARPLLCHKGTDALLRRTGARLPFLLALFPLLSFRSAPAFPRAAAPPKPAGPPHLCCSPAPRAAWGRRALTSGWRPSVCPAPGAPPSSPVRPLRAVSCPPRAVPTLLLEKSRARAQRRRAGVGGARAGDCLRKQRARRW